jgi:hypothetical protein
MDGSIYFFGAVTANGSILWHGAVLDGGSLILCGTLSQHWLAHP